MKLVSYVELPIDQQMPTVKPGALLDNECVVDLAVAQTWAQGTHGFAARDIPQTMLDILYAWQDMQPHLRTLIDLLPGNTCLELKGARRQPVARQRQDVLLLPPLPNILSLRIFAGFEKHARNMARMRSRAVPKSWGQWPLYYYGNPFTLLGPDQPLPIPAIGQTLDYELQIACFIGKAGRNIPVDQADSYIAGYTILNNWSIREIYVQEAECGMSPGRSADFATSLGPALVAPDELGDALENTEAGNRLHLSVQGMVNGEIKSQGSFADAPWTFAQMVAHASRDVTLHPGEVLASGAITNGTLYEQGAENPDQLLQAGDQVSLEVQHLGRLDTLVIEGGL